MNNINDKKILIIYHDKDLDGITSGILLKKAYPNAKLQGYDHGNKIDFDIDKKYIIFADISFSIDKMYELSKNHKIIWIDHHISSYNKYIEFKENNHIKNDFCDVIFNNNYAACINVFKWLYPNKKIPYALQLIGDFDIWNKRTEYYWENKVLPFQYGLRSLTNKIETFPTKILKNNFINKIKINKIIKEGKIIIRSNDLYYEYACRKGSFIKNFNGYRALCLNIVGVNFNAFKSVYDPNKHDLVMPFYYDNGFWHISMYTDKDNVNCAELASQMGGGGHTKAAGFELKDINNIFNEKYK